MKHLVFVLACLMKFADPNFDRNTTTLQLNFTSNFSDPYCIADASNTRHILTTGRPNKTHPTPISLVLISEDMELSEGEKLLAQSTNNTLTVKMLRRECSTYNLTTAKSITKYMANYYYMCHGKIKGTGQLANHLGDSDLINTKEFGRSSAGLISESDKKLIISMATCFQRCKAEAKDCDQCLFCLERQQSALIDPDWKWKSIIWVVVTFVYILVVLAVYYGVENFGQIRRAMEDWLRRRNHNQNRNRVRRPRNRRGVGMAEARL